MDFRLGGRILRCLSGRESLKETGIANLGKSQIPGMRVAFPEILCIELSGFHSFRQHLRANSRPKTKRNRPRKLYAKGRKHALCN